MGAAHDVIPIPPPAPLATVSEVVDHDIPAIELSERANHDKTIEVLKDVAAEEGEAGSPTRPLRSNLQVSFILLALFLSLFVAALDVTIVATAVPVISHDLHSASGYVWIGGAYLLANAAAAPIWAKLSDIWGRKIVMLILSALFFASSLVCATAQSMTQLIVGRSFQGTAGGGLILLVHVVVSDLFSVRLRSLVMGVTEGVWALAGGVGPILGGVFASLASWRWCFYINLPISGLCFVLLLLFLDVKHEKTSFWVGMKAIDWYGTTAFLAFALMLLLGLDFGGVVFPWTSAKVICLIVVGTCMIGVFVYSEAKLAKYPLIPLHTFRDSSNVAAVAVGACHGLAFIPAEYYLPLYWQAVKGASPLRSGILLVPFIVSTAVFGVLTGIVIHKTGQYRQLIWAGTSVLTLGTGLFILLAEDTSLGMAIGLTIVFGLGSGMLFEPPLIAIQSRSKQAEVATATSTFTFGRSIAISISVIIGGVVFQNGMDSQASKLAATGLSASVLQALSGKEAAANVALAKTLTNPVQAKAVRTAFAWSMRNMWIMYTVFAGLGLIAGLFVGKANLSEDHEETVTGIVVPKNDTVKGFTNAREE